MKPILSIAIAIAILAPARVSWGATPTVSFDAGSVHIDQYGDGSPALVLIPGLSASAKVWDSAVARYGPTHRIYVLTLPGFGGHAPIAAPMLDRVAADIADFLPKAEKPIIIGHSMGGYLAIRLAEEHSGLIRGAIAVDGLPVFFGMDKMTAQQRADTGAKASARIRTFSPGQLLQVERALFIPYMTKRQNVDLATSFSEGADPGAVAQYEQELMAADVRGGLNKITVPLLEIVPFDAQIDPKNPPIDPTNPNLPVMSLQAKRQYYLDLLAGDPSAKVVMIDDSRHFIMLDQPQSFYEAVDAFLKALP